MELQTFVEAKESEEPLCWDPWKKRVLDIENAAAPVKKSELR